MAGSNAPNDNAGYTYGYNHSLFAKRVHDVLTVLAWARGGDPQPETVDVIGLAGAGHWVAAARAQAGELIGRAAVDMAGFRFSKIDSPDHPDFWPGAAKYLDAPGLLALSAPHPLWLADEGETGHEITTAAYTAAGAADQLVRASTQGEQNETTAVQWLLQ